MDITAHYAEKQYTATTATEKVIILLKWTFTLVPIAAGADKFLNVLTDWTRYVAAQADMLPFTAQSFMYIVGAIEIAAGVTVFLRPRLGSIVVAAWLVLIATFLLLSGSFLDVAVRDLVMATGAFSLFLLSARKGN